MCGCQWFPDFPIRSLRYLNGGTLSPVPTEAGQGPHCYHGPITKRGNAHARCLLVQVGQHLGQYRGQLGQIMRKIVKRKNRNVTVVACARMLAALLWDVLSSGEPFRYAEPRTLRAKYSRLRVRATGQRRSGGIAKGTPRSAQYGQGRTRSLPSLSQVLETNGLAAVTPISKGERAMLNRKRPDSFYQEIQTPSPIQAHTLTS